MILIDCIGNSCAEAAPVLTVMQGSLGIPSNSHRAQPQLCIGIYPDFFLAEPYRRTGELSILMDEKPIVVAVARPESGREAKMDRIFKRPFMTGAISQDRERCQFLFCLMKNPCCTGRLGREMRERFLMAPQLGQCSTGDGFPARRPRAAIHPMPCCLPIPNDMGAIRVRS